MEPSRLIRVEMSSASRAPALATRVCRVSGERMSHSEKGTCSIAEKEPRRVTYGASFLLLPTFRGSGIPAQIRCLGRYGLEGLDQRSACLAIKSDAHFSPRVMSAPW
jgi:hypothetical protein